jgi:Ni/Co efflux regulator RcnB
MKLLIATVALATMIAAPALAQSNGNRTRADQQNLRGANHVNQLSRTDNGQRHSTNPTHDVARRQRSLRGFDPDARIRHHPVRPPGE